MTEAEIKQKLAHEKWLQPLRNNNVWRAVFRAARSWYVPDMNMKFDYEKR